MIPSTILYILLALGIIGVFMVMGAKAGAVAAFIAFIIVGMWRRYTAQDEDVKFADAAAKQTASAAKKSKKASAAKAQKIAKPGARHTAVSVKPKRLRPPTWKTPTRK